ncbi:small ribosomal subunit protein mS27-like [Watersipora subatra]|uniref:small ribosomal subunit protein mS27-like n=1 Tax=Watersipora subatra TaxID=2589382 RepID=UPI00355BC4DF
MSWICRQAGNRFLPLCMMRKTICLKVLYHPATCVGNQRSLMSKEFYCNSEWQGRLNDSILSKVTTEILLTQLFLQFDKSGAATAIDMEVFSNKVQEVHPTQLHLVENLLKRFRSSQQALSVIDSMSHALIRAYLELDQTDRLIPILQQKIAYGIFPDQFAFCLILDHLIKSNNFQGASKIAIEIMLQGVEPHPSARLLSLYSCGRYLAEHSQTLLAPFTEDDKPELPEGEEEYVVVKFVPLHNFDDHFDITDEKRLIGRTLAFLSSPSESSPVYRSYNLIGLAMAEDCNKLLDYLREFLRQPTDNNTFHREVLDTLSTCLEACKSRSEVIEREPGMELKEDSEYNSRHTLEDRQRFIDEFEELKPRLSATPLLDSSLREDTEELVMKGLATRNETDVKEYKTQLKNWNIQRARNIELQERSLRLKERQQALDEKIAELTDKEALLNYFVRQNEISLGLMNAGKPKEEKAEEDDFEYIAEPGKRGKKR